MTPGSPDRSIPPSPSLRFPLGRRGRWREKLTPSLMSFKHREGCSRWVFDPGILGDCKKKEGVGSQRGHLISPTPSRCWATKPTLPVAGDQSVGAQGACQLSVRRWDPGRHAPARSHGPPGLSASPKINPLIPRCRHRWRLTDEDPGLGTPGRGRVYTWAPFARLKWTHDLNVSQWL